MGIPLSYTCCFLLRPQTPSNHTNTLRLHFWCEPTGVYKTMAIKCIHSGATKQLYLALFSPGAATALSFISHSLCLLLVCTPPASLLSYSQTQLPPRFLSFLFFSLFTLHLDCTPLLPVPLSHGPSPFPFFYSTCSPQSPLYSL